MKQHSSQFCNNIIYLVPIEFITFFHFFKIDYFLP